VVGTVEGDRKDAETLTWWTEFVRHFNAAEGNPSVVIAEDFKQLRRKFCIVV
jgi:hypothetical protein